MDKPETLMTEGQVRLSQLRYAITNSGLIERNCWQCECPILAMPHARCLCQRCSKEEESTVTPESQRRHGMGRPRNPEEE